jgi:hypothetical protein
MLLALLACSPNKSADATPAPEPEPTPAPRATYAQWDEAINNTYTSRTPTKEDVKLQIGKVDENGLSLSRICIEKGVTDCNPWFNASRDSFRKLTIHRDVLWLKGDLMSKYEGRHGVSSVDGYVSLLDCQAPRFFLSPTIRASSWLFMEKFSIMRDGKVIVNREFSLSDVNRDNDNSSITERADFILTNDEIKSLRDIKNDTQILVRFTGQKGYTGLDKAQVSVLVDGITRMLPLYDALAEASENIGLVDDAACPGR